MLNSINDQANRGPKVLVVTWVEFGIALLLVFARILSRTVIVRSVGWSDAFLILTMVTAGCSSIFLTLGVQEGIGRHFYNLTPTEQMAAIKYNWVSQTLSIMTFAFGKVSIGLFLLQIMTKNKWQRFILWYLMTSVVVINTVMVIIVFVQCSPLPKLWNIALAGSCWPPSTATHLAFFVGSYSAFTDLALAAFAIFFFSGLQMELRRKIILSCLMSLGVFAAICSIIKTVNLEENSHTEDFTYGTTDLLIWNSTEMYVIIIAACIPGVKPLWSLLLFKLGLKTRSHNAQYTSDANSYRLESLKRHTVPIGNDRISAESKEDILSDTPPGIVKTTEMSVYWEKPSQDNNREWIDSESGSGERPTRPEVGF
ncbi:MAG: hypothetical protein M1827_006391 [Pycnora praestabilis]|nr:MAG: hypothetical protein M1827_006391 [Pycnora praestabilis]